MKGEFRHNMDAKGRVFLPAKLREELGQSFVITRGMDSCLAVYPQSEWEALESKIRALPMSKSRDLQRFFFANAFDAEPDSQGRVLLPQSLRSYASLEKEIVMIGAGSHAEIWSAEKWQAYNESITEERVLEAMQELGF